MIGCDETIPSPRIRAALSPLHKGRFWCNSISPLNPNLKTATEDFNFCCGFVFILR